VEQEVPPGLTATLTVIRREHAEGGLEHG